MTRYDPFAEMDRTFEQLRTRMWADRRMPGSDRPALGRDRPMLEDDRLALDSDRRMLGDAFRPESSGEVSVRDAGQRMRSSRTTGLTRDLTKRDDEYVFVADLPGFETEEIDLTFADGVLTVAAEHEASETADATDETSRRSWHESRRVAERVPVAAEIDRDAIAASYRNGVLEVHLPLLAPEASDDETRIDISA